MNKTSMYIVGGVVIGIATLFALWFIFSSTNTLAPTTNEPPTFGTGVNTVLPSIGTSTNTLQPLQNQTQRIFKVSDGPVAGAGFFQTFQPTTTLARWIMAADGHALEVAVDSPGAVPRPLSNTTLPGIQSAEWLAVGTSTLMQYLQGTTIKTVLMSISSSTSSPTRIFFFPDGIVGTASSPDGKSVAYLLRTSAGVDGYVSKPDGTGSKKIFSLPLSQVHLSWPSQNTFLVYTNPAAGVPGIAFSIHAVTGVVTPLVYAEGLSAIADETFDRVIYQTAKKDATTRTTLIHDVRTGADKPLSFDPIPEKCLATGSSLICAVPLSGVPTNYLDLWHQGVLGVADMFVSFDLLRGSSSILATPGEQDGGIATDVLSFAVSPDGKYLLFVSKNDRSLWGVRLSQ